MDSGLAAPGNKLSSPLLALRTGAKPKSYRFKYRFNEAKAIRLQHEQIKGTIGCLIRSCPIVFLKSLLRGNIFHWPL
jgi:hypothetical protein